MAHRDRLDGTKSKNIIVELYTLPGRLWLWIEYMFPDKGYSKTRKSARHARSPVMTFLYSTLFWIAIALFLLLVYYGEDDATLSLYQALYFLNV